MPGAQFVEALRHLARHDVELIVVGMLSAVLQGAPVTTFDVDIVHRRTPENVKKLIGALNAIDAIYRNDRRRIAPGESHLLGPGHQLLTTRFGDIDCLGAIDGDRTYEELVGQTVVLELGEGLSCRALAIEQLLGIKERAGRPKDIAVLPVLRATIAERDKDRET